MLDPDRDFYKQNSLNIPYSSSTPTIVSVLPFLFFFLFLLQTLGICHEFVMTRGSIKRGRFF